MASPQSPVTVDITPLHTDAETRKGFIDSLFLSQWNHILGPRVKKMWNVGGGLVCEKALEVRSAFFSRLILNGEICREEDNSSIDSKVFDISDHDALVCGSVFTANLGEEVGILALSFSTSRANRAVFLQLQTLLVSHIKKIISDFRLYLYTKKLDGMIGGLHYLTGPLSTFVELENKLCDSSLQIPRELPATENPWKIDGMNDDFLTKAVWAHLACGGRAIVVGKDNLLVNKVLCALSVFNTPMERAQSLLWHPGPVFHNLTLQGISSFDEKSEDRGLFLSHLPAAVIYVDLERVCWCHLDEYQYRATHYLSEYNLRVITGQPLPPSNIYYTDSAICKSEVPSEAMVSRCIKEMISLTEGWPGYIQHFTRFLEKKAHCFISIVEEDTINGQKRWIDDNKELQKALSLPLEGDFLIVLAKAEKVKVGLAVFLDDVNWGPSGSRSQFLNSL